MTKEVNIKIFSEKLTNIFVRFFYGPKCVCFFLLLTFSFQSIKSQNIEAKVIAYNALIGGITGGIGALINKKKEQKWHKALVKGFVIGLGGGAICYSGKKLNALVAKNNELGFCYLSRAVFSAGNSIVENAASNQPFWSRWHYDIGFMRLELQTKGPVRFTPRFMPSSFGGIVFMAVNSQKVDTKTSLQSGTITFRTNQVSYATHLVASTASNGFLFVNSLQSGQVYFDTYAHEMVHAFQFQEFSGCNYFFNPLTDKWKANSPRFKKASKWIYGDVNFELMLINYFFINQAYKDTKNDYCKNYLENEAEHLSVGRSACFEQ